MIELEKMQSVPLQTDEGGTIRVAESRVTLDSLLGRFKQGFGAEEIQESFPSLRLDDIYAVLAYYLRHETEVEAYLDDRAEKASAVRQLWEQRPATSALRQRLRARLARRQVTT